MKKIIFVLLSASFILYPAGCFCMDERDAVYQVSTINALMEGIYDGDVSLSELKEQGDTGIGTFNALDGEMICVGGKFFRIKADGKAYRADIVSRTPYAMMAYFAPFSKLEMVGLESLGDLEGFLDANVPLDNLFYAIKITGTFKYVKTRSVPAQNTPYPPLSEVTKTQPTFEYHDIRGTLVGFRSPAYMKGICPTGYHFHFLSEDQAVGGHLLECSLTEGAAEIDDKGKFFLKLPYTMEFKNADLTGDRSKELAKVE